ncbi:MAG: HAMP domain-containing sensor histidine kinase [Planctomycetota bacterium]
MDPERGGEGRRGRAFWRGSLRAPIAAAVIAANLVTLSVVLFVTEAAARSDRAKITEDYTLQLRDHLDDVVDVLGRLRPASALEWRGWRWYDDVIVAQRPVERGGAFVVDGVYLNPLGRLRRDGGFDEQRALAMIAEAMETGDFVDSSSGTAAPIGAPDAPAWGGVWYRTRPITIAAPRTLTIVPFFVATLLLVTAATLALLRRNVLDPVAELAGVARRLEAGELSARVASGTDREDELGDLVGGFNDMAERLERYSHGLEDAVNEATERVRAAEAAAMTQRRLAATGELAAGIAHELNNPLGGLVNAVEALKRDDLAPERRAEYLELVSGGLRRMGETVGRLLRLSPRDARTAEVDLARPLADALGLVRHRAESIGLTLEVAGPGRAFETPRDPFTAGALKPFERVPPIRGAANELGQALLNLLVNAVDAIEEAGHGSRIVARMDPIEAGDFAGGVRIVVEDDGPGVDEDVLARASDAFFTTKEQGRGTGLGLAIVHNVVTAHGGRVLLSSRPGRGFRAELELPAGPPEGAAT